MGAQPIFVLGLQRSGTTWVGNLLEAHPDVAAVAAPRHQGIHESLFFSHFARAWDWSDPAQRAAAQTAFLTSDYCELMHLCAAERRQVRKAKTAADTFAAAMDLYAWSQDAGAWVEKSPHHTRHAEEIAEALPGALFVVIHRDTPSLLASRLNAYGRTPPAGPRRLGAILRAAASNAFHKRQVDRLARRNPARVVRVDFAALQSGGDAAVTDLLDRLNLAPAPGLTPRFRANSSFGDAAARARALSRGDRIVARLADAAVALIPGPVLSGLRAMAVGRRIVFPDWVWCDTARFPPDIAVARPRNPNLAALSPAAGS